MSTATEIMAVAQKYIGTKESPPNSNNVIFNTDYYGGAVSGNDYPWCCVFVWDIFRMAGASNLFYDGKRTAYCPTYESWAINKGLSVGKGNGQFGDVATMDFGKGRASHIGFILSKNIDGSYQTIEGNTSITSNDNGGAVMIRTRSQSVIRYIFRPQYSSRGYLQKGDSGSEVKTMQTMLIALGYSCGTSGADGDFGYATDVALRAFQVNQGLTVDGQYGTKSKAALEGIYNSMATSLKTPNFTAARFLQEVKAVYVMAHQGSYIYSDSQTLPPCADHKISCDRLVSRALWNLGFTDQRKGGEVVGSMPTYLPAHGFQKITDISKIKAGDIVIVDDGGQHSTPYATWHVFVVASYDAKTGMCTKYDTGSLTRIRSSQPFTAKLLEWGSAKRFYAAYRTTYEERVKGDLDGTYEISSAVDRNFMIDVKSASTATKANVQLYKKNGTQAQKFKFEHIKDGYYRIANIKSNKVLDVQSGKAKNKQNIQQYPWNETKAQLWKPQKNSDGSYTFISALNKSYVLDLSGANASNGRNIWLYKSNGTNAQKWYLVKA